MLKTITTLFLCFTSSLLFAQTQEFTDKDLTQFAEAFQQVRFINQSSQQDMVKALEAEGLSVERFNMINQAEQNPNKDSDATEEELNQYKSAMESVESIQAKTQEDLLAKISATGLSLERYQQIATQLQSDENLQKRLSEIMKK